MNSGVSDLRWAATSNSGMLNLCQTRRVHLEDIGLDTRELHDTGGLLHRLLLYETHISRCAQF